MQTAIEWLAAIFILVGAFFLLVGAIGLVRLPDFYMRLHAPTKASTLGVGGVLLASIVLSAAQGRPGIPELLITLFVFVTAPVSANLLAQAALLLPTGGGDQRNVVCQLFSIITRPVIGITRRLAPKAISDRRIPPLAFFLLFCLWIALACVRQVVCRSNVCG